MSQYFYISTTEELLCRYKEWLDNHDSNTLFSDHTPDGFMKAFITYPELVILVQELEKKLGSA